MKYLFLIILSIYCNLSAMEIDSSPQNTPVKRKHSEDLEEKKFQSPAKHQKTDVSTTLTPDMHALGLRNTTSQNAPVSRKLFVTSVSTAQHTPRTPTRPRLPIMQITPDKAKKAEVMASLHEKLHSEGFDKDVKKVLSSGKKDPLSCKNFQKFFNTLPSEEQNLAHQAMIQMSFDVAEAHPETSKYFSSPSKRLDVQAAAASSMQSKIINPILANAQKNNIDPHQAQGVRFKSITHITKGDKSGGCHFLPATPERIKQTLYPNNNISIVNVQTHPQTIKQSTIFNNCDKNQLPDIAKQLFNNPIASRVNSQTPHATQTRVFGFDPLTRNYAELYYTQKTSDSCPVIDTLYPVANFVDLTASHIPNTQTVLGQSVDTKLIQQIAQTKAQNPSHRAYTCDDQASSRSFITDIAPELIQNVGSLPRGITQGILVRIPDNTQNNE